MGTRGLIGFRKNGIDKLTYNHFDSYPEYLGKKVLEFIVGYREDLDSIFDNIILVNETDRPTKEQIEECKEFTDLSVSTRSNEEWYCLLRKAQGNLRCYAQGLKYMIDNHDFILDSVFCEYAYIINLDNHELEFWVGFQHEPCEDNRYGCETTRDYYPCKMVATYPLSDIHEEQIDDIVEDMQEKAKD